MPKAKPTSRRARRPPPREWREQREQRETLEREVAQQRRILTLASQLARLIDRSDRQLRILAESLAAREGERLVPDRDARETSLMRDASLSHVGADVPGGGAN